MEGGREVHSMGLLAEFTQAGPRGGCTCHKGCRILDLLPGDQRPLPQCILAEKATWSTTLQVPMERRGDLRHPVLFERPFA